MHFREDKQQNVCQQKKKKKKGCPDSLFVLHLSAREWESFRAGSVPTVTFLLCTALQWQRDPADRESGPQTQLFLIGNSAPMADLHSAARTSLNPWPCQTQPWGEGRKEKNKKEKEGWASVGKKDKEKKKKEKKNLFFVSCSDGLIDV